MEYLKINTSSYYLIALKIIYFILFCACAYILLQLNFELQNSNTTSLNLEIFTNNLNFLGNLSKNDLSVFIKVGIVNCVISAFFSLMISKNKTFIKNTVLVSSLLTLMAVAALSLY